MASTAKKTRAPALIRFLAASLASGLVYACSTAPKLGPSDIPPLSGGEVPQLQMHNLRQVSDEMAAFMAEYVPPTMPLRQRIWKLAYAASDPYLLQFRYDPSITLPPAETFRRRTGNCLSYSLMLVAMARQAGIPARFEAAILKPEWRSVNDTFINSRHINVVLGRASASYLVDVSGKVFEEELETRPISDSEAEAQYYNNLGVEALLENDLPTAWARFRQAIKIDPGLGFLWSNLGVVYNRSQQVDDAEWAYKTALSVDRREAIAVNNLYVIYKQEGRAAEAARLEDRVERHRKRNPYYLAMLASEALQSRQYEDAIDLLQRSIRINGEEYRFHGALAQAQYLAGDHEEALSSLDTARSLAPPDAAAELESLPLRNILEY